MSGSRGPGPVSHVARVGEGPAGAIGEISPGAKAGEEEERSPPQVEANSGEAGLILPVPGWPIFKNGKQGSVLFARFSQPEGSRAGLNHIG